ncbi:MAG: PAS domain S-box protein [candidate division Zixibacteria bacterium]|jgi:PAS domain S-box-containing protein|nr:PAS domain S-box protein [candidate division Zixibacteria bacterium]
MIELLPVAVLELDLSGLRPVLLRWSNENRSSDGRPAADAYEAGAGTIRIVSVNAAAREILVPSGGAGTEIASTWVADAVVDAAGVLLSGGRGFIPTRIAAGEGNWIAVQAQLLLPSGAEGAWTPSYLVLRSSSEHSSRVDRSATEAHRMRSMLDAAPVGYQSLDSDGRILEVNAAWLETLGFRREEVIGRSLADFMTEPHRARFHESFSRFKKAGFATGVEYDLVRSDGLVLSLLFNGRILYNEDGSVDRTICIMHDITERRQMEDELRESELRFQQLASTINELFWLRTEREMLYVSPAYERIFGRTCLSLYEDHLSFLEGIHPADRDLLRMAHEREWERGVPVDTEVRVVRSDGTTRWIWIRTFHVHGKDGEVVRSAGIAEDITDRKYAEEALHESIARFRNIVEAAEAGYFFVDLEGRYGYVNLAWLRMHKYLSPGEVIGRPFEITTPAIDSHLAPVDIESMLSSENGFQCECARLCKDGSIGYHLFSGNPVVANGRQIGIEGFLIDITDRKIAEQALRESEERFRAAFQTSPDAIAINRESDGMYVDINEGFERITGYRREDIVGVTSLDMDIWVDRADRVRLVDALSERGYMDNLVAQFRMKDGRIITGNMCARSFMIAGLRHNLTITRDITRETAAQAVLAKRDRVLSAVATVADVLLRSEDIKGALDEVLRVIGQAAEVSRVYVFRNDRDTRYDLTCSQIAEWADEGIEPQINNPEMQRLSYTETGIDYWIATLGNNDAIFGETDSFDDPIRSVFVDQDIQSVAIVPIFAANRWWGFMGFDDCRQRRQWSRTELDALRSAAGIIGARIERHRAEQELRESETKFREIAEMLPEAVFESDAEGRITYANQKATQYFGFETRDYSRGLSILDVIVPEERERALASHQQLLRTGEHGVVEYTGVRKDGVKFPISVRSSRIVRNGVPVGTRGVVIDISMEKAYEREQLRSQKLESLGILAGGLAHDFNNLLTGILGNISIARLSEKLDTETDQGLEVAERAAMRARDLTQQLLTFSKGGEPVKKVISVEPVLRESVTFALRGSNVRAEISIAEDLKCIDADAGQISQVIHNLTINAVQAMPEGGTITVRACNRLIKPHSHPALGDGAYVEISVADEGLGIPERLLARIFDPYFTTKQTGSGLGLASSYSIVKKHGGHIDVSSIQGTGTTFTVYLPACGVNATPDPQGEELPAVGSGRILLMDDEGYIRDLATRVLSKAGFEIDCAAHGREAIELFEAARSSGVPYDVVILDLTVPGGMGGRETLEHLQTIDPGVRAIVCSGYSNDPILSRYGEVGFAAMVTKPYRPGELVQAVTVVLGSERVRSRAN